MSSRFGGFGDVFKRAAASRVRLQGDQWTRFGVRWGRSYEEIMSGTGSRSVHIYIIIRTWESRCTMYVQAQSTLNTTYESVDATACGEGHTVCTTYVRRIGKEMVINDGGKNEKKKLRERKRN